MLKHLHVMADKMVVPERAVDYRIYSNEGSEKADGNLSQSPSFGSSTEDAEVNADAINKRKYTLNDWWAAAEEETTHPDESDADPCTNFTEYDSTGSPNVVMLKQASAFTEGEPELEPESGNEADDIDDQVPASAAVIASALGENVDSQRSLVARLVITGEDELAPGEGDTAPFVIRRPEAADRRTGADPGDKGFWDYFWIKLNAQCCMSEAR